MAVLWDVWDMKGGFLREFADFSKAVRFARQWAMEQDTTTQVIKADGHDKSKFVSRNVR